MAFALFLLDNRVDSATLAASSTAAGGAMPVTNIQSEARSDIWRSGPGSSSFVDITFGSAGTVNAAAFVDLNLSTVGTIRIQAWTDAINGAASVLDRTDPPNVFGYGQQSYAYGAGAYGTGNYALAVPLADQMGRNVTLIPLAAPVAARFWRVTFSDGNTLYQQVSRIYLTTPKQYTYNLSFGWGAARRPRSVKKESLGGQNYTQKRDSRLALDVAFDYLTETERANVLVTLQSYGEDRPFVFAVYPGNDLQGLTTSVYCTYEGAKVVHRNYNISSFTFTAVEEF